MHTWIFKNVYFVNKYKQVNNNKTLTRLFCLKKKDYNIITIRERDINKKDKEKDTSTTKDSIPRTINEAI